MGQGEGRSDREEEGSERTVRTYAATARDGDEGMCRKTVMRREIGAAPGRGVLLGYATVNSDVWGGG